MLEKIRPEEAGVFVVWQSILPTDWTRPGARILMRVHAARARQYWDPENRFAQRLRDRMWPDAAHPKPACCVAGEGIPWDLVAVYPAGARWEESLPAAVYIDGPVWRVQDSLTEAVESEPNGLPRKQAEKGLYDK